MLLRTIYERNQMNRILKFKGNRAKRYACASSNICRMPHPSQFARSQATKKTSWKVSGSYNMKRCIKKKPGKLHFGRTYTHTHTRTD
jgi:hypothetical protein